MGSNAVKTPILRTFLRDDVKLALGGITVGFEDPRTPAGQPSGYAVPYALIKPLPVDISFGGRVGSVQRPSQENEFQITIRKAWPDESTLIIEAKELDANAVIAQLQSGADYHGIGIWPLVTKVDWGEGDDPNEQIYELKLMFSVATVSDHHGALGLSDDPSTDVIIP